MSKRLRKLFYITDKKDIREEELENKSLEDLLTEKDSEHDFISINIPIIFSCVWIMISAMLSIKPEIRIQYPKLRFRTFIFIMFTFIRILVILINIVKEHNTISKNIKIYDKEIFKRLEKHEKKKIALLKEIRDNTKYKNKK